MGNMWSKRLARVGLCTLVVAVAAGGPAIGTSGAWAASGSSQAKTAHDLARGVLKAHGAQQRYRALVQVAKALHVGVYKANGKPVVRGAERSWHDLYLYDFELKPAMTSAFDRRVTHSLDDVAGQFSAVSHDILKGRLITAASLAGSIRKALAWAKKHPRGKGIMDVLLVRELGKQQYGYDLAGKPKLSKVKLDALQM